MVAARTIDGSEYPERIEEMDRELTNIIEDFDRAMNFEALRLSSETSKLSFPPSADSRISRFWCRASRAGPVIQASYARQDQLSPQSPLYGGYPTISPQSRNELGSQQIETRECSPKEYVLVLRLTRNRKNVVSAFDLRKPSRTKPPCWCIFLPEGRPEFERARKYPSDFHPQSRHDLPAFSNDCGKTPS